MNILIVGNGFDLAHGLPTTYMDFLDFMNNSVEYYKDQNFSLHHMSETDVLYGFKKMIDKKKHYGIKEIEVSEFLGDDNGKWLFHPNRQTNYGEIFDEVLKKNSWLTYFNVKKGSKRRRLD